MTSIRVRRLHPVWEAEITPILARRGQTLRLELGLKTVPRRVAWLGAALRQEGCCPVLPCEGEGKGCRT